MARTAQHGTTRDFTTTEAEQRLLRFLTRTQLYRDLDWVSPSFTVAELAAHLGLAHEVCCQALYWLVRRDQLHVELLDAGRFRLLPRGDLCRQRAIGSSCGAGA